MQQVGSPFRGKNGVESQFKTPVRRPAADLSRYRLRFFLFRSRFFSTFSTRFATAHRLPKTRVRTMAQLVAAPGPIAMRRMSRQRVDGILALPQRVDDHGVPQKSDKVVATLRSLPTTGQPPPTFGNELLSLQRRRPDFLLSRRCELANGRIQYFRVLPARWILRESALALDPLTVGLKSKTCVTACGQ